MADITRTVEVIFQGTDRIGSTITTISGRLDYLANSVQSAAQPFADLADTALKAEAALAALAIGGLAYAASKSIDFETAMTGLKKVLGDNIDDLNMAKAAALEFSGTYGVAATEIVDATTGFVQAGFELNDALKLVDASLKLTIAGNLEAAESQDFLTRIIKGFKAEAEDAARIIDILNEISNNYATDVRELATGMAELAPIAKTAGLSFEETAAVLTQVIEVFGSGSEAAQALKTGLLRLIDDSAPVKAALESISVSQFDLNGEMRSAKDILFDVGERFKTLDENQKLVIASQLVGINQAARMVEVFNNFDQIQEKVTTGMGAFGSAQKEVNTFLESAQLQIDRVVAKWEVLNVAIGDRYLQATKQAISGTAEILDALNAAIASGAFDEIFDLIDGVAQNIANRLSEIAANIPEAFEQVDFLPFLDSLKKLGDEIGDLFESFFGEIDLKTPEGLANAIQRIVDTGTALNNVVTGIVEALGPFVAALGDAISAFVDSDEAVQQFVGNFLGFSRGLVEAIDAIQTFISALNLIGQAISVLALGWLSKLIGTLTGVGGISAGFIGAGAAAIAFVADLERTDESIGQVLSRTINDFVGGLTAMGGGFVDAAREVLGLSAAEEQLTGKQRELATVIQEATANQRAWIDAIDDTPEDISIDFKVTGGASEDLQSISDEIDEIAEKDPAILITAKKDDGFDPVVSGIVAKVDEETGVITIKAAADQQAINETKAAINEIPSEKLLEIKLQGQIDTEIARIKAQADTIQTAVEWKAKLDIAEVEANTEIVKTAFESINTTITSTGQVISDVFKIFGSLTPLEQIQIEKYLQKEYELREKAVALQEQLTNAQIEYINARTAAIEAGEGLITITGEGLEPEIEAFMWRILEKIQIKAAEDQAQFLLGIT